MDGGKALLIATYDYVDDGLRQLAAPQHDVKAFAEVLADPEIAGFDVTTLINKTSSVVAEAIDDFYTGCRGNQLTLLYFSGHGLKDDRGDLYLAMGNTQRHKLRSTALSAAHVKGAMEDCSSRRNVLILDCCYGGAFPAGYTAKADEGVQTLERFHGKGRAVLTATDATQYAFEGDDLRGSGASSLFTRYLVEGIRTGAADLNEDGDISLDELYSYVYDRVVAEMPYQRPKKLEEVDGQIVLARNVRWRLPEHLSYVLDSPFAEQRLVAVKSLGQLYRVGNHIVRDAVWRHLASLADDDSRSVSAAAKGLLDTIASPHESRNSERARRKAEPKRWVVPGGTVVTGPRGAADEYADLEMGLHRRDAVTWTVELRFSLPRTDAETQLDVSGPLLAYIDPRELDAIDDDEEYGLALGSGLLGPEVWAAVRTAAATSQSQGVRLRVRLVMGSSATALHGLRWETLRSPIDRSTLLTNENVLFSRYLSSQDWRPVGVRPREDLTALAVVAGPSKIGSFHAGRRLAPVRVNEEMARAREGLASLSLTTLPGAAAPTAANLLDQVRRGVDVLYLVCHGYVVRGEPVLLLVDEDGHAAPLLGSELISQLRDLPRLPQLVFLASCQSAGAGDDRRSEDAGVLAALGPRLAEAGVPAVVAMQGNITMTTTAAFTKTFFQSLEEDGLVDRAMAVARAAVRDRPDWWVPALFMRLKSGRLWYEPGTAPGGERFDKWPSLITDLKDGTCTPVIGPGITDTLLGTRQQIAMAWARSYRFPMAPYNRESLPQVAQYLAVNQNRRFLRHDYMSYLHRTLMERYRDDLPADLLREDASLEDLLAAAWRARHRREEVEPFSVLAQLPAPVYITTSYTRLLSRALTDAGRRPEVDLCRWHEDADWPESVFEREPGYRPTPERPLIYHLLGTFDEPESLVLTEDDYFKFLIGVSRNQDLVPKVVRRRLSDSALMFLGFGLDEWDFRILYSSLMNSQEGWQRHAYTHIAVQDDPEEGATIDAGRARRYLETYFSSARVSLYWGGTEHFVKELQDAWDAHR